MLILPRVCLAQIIAHTETGYPNEVCGFLLGHLADDDKTVQTVLPLFNAARSRENRFAVSPRDSYQAEKTARQSGQSIVGVFHSHPDTSAHPSQTDRIAAWPFYSYLIVSVQNGSVVQTASWILTEDENGPMKEETLCLE